MRIQVRNAEIHLKNMEALSITKAYLSVSSPHLHMGEMDFFFDTEKVAKLWSELNSVEITPEMINCVGCRIDGVKTPYCESLCPIRQCALIKRVETCGSCTGVMTCETAGMIHKNNEEARRNLGL